MNRVSSSIAVAVALCLAGARARANCALGASYEAVVSGSSVWICTSRHSCSGSDVLLRQDHGSGAVVALPGFCSVPDTGPGGPILDPPGCLADECVPPGTYRYGLAAPYSCLERGCDPSVPYWVDVHVTAPLADGGCTRSAGNGAPAAYGQGLPWPASGDGIQQCTGCSCSSASTVLGFDGAVLSVAPLLLWRQRRRRAPRAG